LSSEPRVVDVQVHGQRYPIKTTLEPAYVHELASFVDRKMSQASEVAPASDILALAILAALNISDELLRARDQRLNDAGELSARTQALERIVDQALTLAGS